jgi:predicted PurR-regulated permease PerM
MIVVITIIVIIGIVLIIDSIREFNRNINQIRELEQRLTEYYNKRENRLLKKFKDIEQQ